MHDSSELSTLPIRPAFEARHVSKYFGTALYFHKDLCDLSVPAASILNISLLWIWFVYILRRTMKPDNRSPSSESIPIHAQQTSQPGTLHRTCDVFVIASSVLKLLQQLSWKGRRMSQQRLAVFLRRVRAGMELSTEINENVCCLETANLNMIPLYWPWI